MKSGLFTKKQKDAIDTVLLMGLIIDNGMGKQLTNIGGEYQYDICDEFWQAKQYKSLSNCLTQFLKSE